MKKEQGVESAGSLTPELEAPHSTAHLPRTRGAADTKGETA